MTTTMIAKTMDSWAGWSAAAFFLTASVASAATFVVNDSADRTDAVPGDGRCEATPGQGDCTLRAAIQEADAFPGPDQVVLPAGRFVLAIPGQGEDAAAEGDLDVTESLSIRGAGEGQTVLDAAGIDRLFDVPSAAAGVSFTIADVTLRGGASSAVRSLADGATVTMRHCAVEENRTAAAGGAAYVDRGTLSLVDCRVTRNCARMQGGAIRIHRGHLELEDTDVAGDDAPTGRGAEVYASYSTVSMVRSRIGRDPQDPDGTLADLVLDHAPVAQDDTTRIAGLR